MKECNESTMARKQRSELLSGRFDREPGAPEGKVLLKIAHYRTFEIEESEINDLVNMINRSGAETCEYVIVNNFFHLTKKELLESRTCGSLSDREVKTLWERFKENAACLLKKEGM